MRRVPLHLAVFALFLVVAILATSPVIRELGSVLPGEKALVNWYLYRTLLGRPLSEWLNPHFPQLDFPQGGTAIVVALPEFFVARLLTVALGPLTAFNVSLLLHLAFGGYGGWRLSHRAWGELPGGEWPHLAAGAVLGVSNFAIGVYANGQPENLGIGYVALAAEAALALGQGAGAGAILGLGVAIALAFLSSPYLVMGFLLAGAPLLLARAAWRARVFAGVLVVLGVVGAFYVHFERTMPSEERRVLCPTMLEVDPPPATLVDAFDPLAVLRTPTRTVETLVLDLVWVLHPPQLTSAKAHERLLGYLGWAAVGLAALGIVRAGKERRWLLLSMLPPLVLAMGPNFTINGWSPTVHGAPLRLPLFYLDALPLLGGVFATINAPVRLVIGLLLPVSLAAARGAAALPRLGPLLVVLPVLDQLLLGSAGPPQHPWPVHEYGVYAALAEQTDGGAMFDTPPVGTPPNPPPVGFTRALVQDAWRHGHPTPYAGCFPPLYNQSLGGTAFVDIVARIGAGEPDQGRLAAAVGSVRSRGFGWWVIHTGTGIQDAAADARILAAADASFRRVASAPDGTYLFALSP
jgi:hypothetical protein